MLGKISVLYRNRKCVYDDVTKWLSVLRKLRYNDVVVYLYQPTDPSSLGIIRFLFGLLMSIDVFEERSGSEIDIRWGDTQNCHFPLFSVLRPLPYPFMCLLYGVMWLGAIGVMLGYKFKISIFLFGIPYWYILLLDKSFWNNHSYLFGVVTILFAASSASNFFSLDSIIDRDIRNKPVPYWNYFILKFQFFLLYFLAGLKKTDREWLDGYSLTRLGENWVFFPFRIILSIEQIDYLIVHWIGFLLDLTIGFWMLLEFSRPIAMAFCAMFHLMNSRLFSIGMFPYVCLVTLPLFCKENWPKALWNNINKKMNLFFTRKFIEEEENKVIKHKQSCITAVKMKDQLVVACLLIHMALQFFLPYSHFITKGYNTWTKGLYGYSWDMMVHSWDTVLVVVKVVDNKSGEEHFLDPKAWTLNSRWNKHADMTLQYAQCLKQNLVGKTMEDTDPKSIPVQFSNNISIYFDVWCSLNERFQQRMYNPHYDLLKANWSPFSEAEWIMPLMVEHNNLRKKLFEITEHVYSWNNRSDVLFVADFPGMHLENYIEGDVKNVSLTVLKGEVLYEIEDIEAQQSVGVKLKKGENISVLEGISHKVHTISAVPSCYMYTFTREYIEEEVDAENDIKRRKYSPFPLIEDNTARKAGFLRMMKLIKDATFHLMFDTQLSMEQK